MQVSIQGLISFIAAQCPIRKTSNVLWESCIIADYVTEVIGVPVPRTSASVQLIPYLEELRKDPEFGKIVAILSSEAIPETYGELLGYISPQLPAVAKLLQTQALA